MCNLSNMITKLLTKTYEEISSIPLNRESIYP